MFAFWRTEGTGTVLPATGNSRNVPAHQRLSTRSSHFRLPASTAGLLPLAFAVAAAGLASAATWTVSPTGAGQFLTVQQAVDAAAAGDTIQLMAGVHETLTSRNMGGVIYKAIAWIDKPLHFFGDVTSIVRGDSGDETYGFWSNAAGPQTFEGMQVWNVVAAFWPTGAATIRRVLWDNVYYGVALFGPNASGAVVDCSGTRTRGFGVAAFDRAQATVLRCEVNGATLNAVAVLGSGHSSVDVRDCMTWNATILQLQGGSTGAVSSCEAIDLEGVGIVAGDEGTVLTIRRTKISGKLPTQQIPRGLISDSYAHVDAESLTVRNCHTSIIFENRGTGSVRNSTLFPWTSRAVEVRGYLNHPTFFDLTSNCWGTADSLTISASIQDGYDDVTGRLTGWVQFMPVRQCAVPTPTRSIGSLKAGYGVERGASSRRQ
jgi:hypothetical protein